jgi:hypothetical protein
MGVGNIYLKKPIVFLGKDNPCILSRWFQKLSVLDIPVDIKELTANCVVETCTKLRELILVAMVLKCGVIKVQRPKRLMQDLKLC